MQKQRRNKQMKAMTNPIPQSYISNISDIFIHPSQLLYILVDTQGSIRVFDIPTMSILNKSYMKVQNGYRVYRCMFSKSQLGLFYTLCRKQVENPNQTEQNQTKKLKKGYHYILNMHYVSKKNQIISNTCPIDLNQNLSAEMGIQVQLTTQIKVSNLKKDSQQNRNIHNEKLNNQLNRINQSLMEQNNILDQRQQQQDIIKQLQLLQKQQANQQKDQAKNDKYFYNEMRISQKNQSQQSVQKIENMEMQQQNNKTNRLQQLQPQLPPVIPPQPHPHLQYNIKQQPDYNGYNNATDIILELSTFACNLSKNNIPHLSYNDIQFTMLVENGFYFCNLGEKLTCIELGMRVIAGVNIYGNLDSSQQLDHGQSNSIYDLCTTGSEYGDLWLIFTQNSCLLIQMPSNSNSKNNVNKQVLKDPKIYSQLLIDINNCYQSLYRPTIQPKDPKLFSKFNDTVTNKLVSDNRKKLCLVLTAQKQLCIISYRKLQLNIIGKIKLNNPTLNTHLQNTNIPIIQLINFIGLARFGLNTNTSNKYQNKFMVFLAINNILAIPNVQADKDNQKQKNKQKEGQIFQIQLKSKQMQKEKQKQKQVKKVKQKQLKPNCNVYVYSFDLNNQSNSGLPTNTIPNYMGNQKSQNPEIGQQLVTVFKQFSQVKKIWYSQFLENKLNYLNLDNNVQMIDICRLLDGRNTGKQWVNLGYRFQALQTNQLYEELEDQFQLTAEQSKDSSHNVDNGINSIRNKLNELNDWSYCQISRDVILNKRLKRLNCIDM